MQTPRLSSLSSVASGTRGARLGLLASRLPATPAFLPLRPLRLVSASVLASALLLERDALLLHLGTACSFSPLRPRCGSAAASSKKPSPHDLCHIVPSSSPCASVTTSQSLAFCIMTAIITTHPAPCFAYYFLLFMSCHSSVKDKFRGADPSSASFTVAFPESGTATDTQGQLGAYLLK